MCALAYATRKSVTADRPSFLLSLSQTPTSNLNKNIWPNSTRSFS